MIMIVLTVTVTITTAIPVIVIGMIISIIIVSVMTVVIVAVVVQNARAYACAHLRRAPFVPKTRSLDAAMSLIRSDTDYHLLRMNREPSPTLQALAPPAGTWGSCVHVSRAGYFSVAISFL